MILNFLLATFIGFIVGSGVWNWLAAKYDFNLDDDTIVTLVSFLSYLSGFVSFVVTFMLIATT